jgi:hypothetical protein
MLQVLDKAEDAGIMKYLEDGLIYVVLPECCKIKLISHGSCNISVISCCIKKPTQTYCPKTTTSQNYYLKV